MTTEFLSANRGLDRRVFVKGVGLVSVGLILSTLGGCETLIEAIKNRPVRRRLRTGSADVDAAIAIYRDAVSAMKALPGSDPRSWTAQAAIHGSVTGGFNLCQHGTNHFFSWHRAYLLYFERICQNLTGQTSFGLPYWNWNQTPDIHPAFTVSGSSLSHPRVKTTVAGSSAFSNSTMDTIFSDTNFFTFSSQLEGSPHGTAHVLIGGDMGGGGSARDPLFWTHHCMVDYCWAKWNIELGNDNTNDPAWTGTSWDHFVDGTGNPASVTAGLTTVMPLLSYRYESSAVGSSPAVGELSAADFKKIEKRIKEGAAVRFDIKKRVRVAERARISIARPFSQESRLTASDLTALIEADSARERIFASVNYARMPPVNDFFVRVFINMPDANAGTPTDDPHFAGSFAFFGTHVERAGAGHGQTDFLVDVMGTLRKLRGIGQLRPGQPISVQLVAVPATERFIKPEAELQLEGIDLIVTPVVIRTR